MATLGGCHLPFRQAFLHERAVSLGGGRRFAFVPACVAEPAGGSDVAGHVLAALLLGHQVLSGATERRGRFGAQAERL